MAVPQGKRRVKRLSAAVTVETVAGAGYEPELEPGMAVAVVAGAGGGPEVGQEVALDGEVSQVRLQAY